MRRHLAPLLMTAFAVAALVVLYFRDPRVTGNYPPCPFHFLTGYHCPGCGSMRGLHLLMHGHPVAAFGSNPLAMILLPFLLAAMAYEFFRERLKPAWPRLRLSNRFVTALLVVIAVYWIARNLPWYPFTLLAP